MCNDWEKVDISKLKDLNGLNVICEEWARVAFTLINLTCMHAYVTTLLYPTAYLPIYLISCPSSLFKVNAADSCCTISSTNYTDLKWTLHLSSSQSCSKPQFIILWLCKLSNMEVSNEDEPFHKSLWFRFCCKWTEHTWASGGWMKEASCLLCLHIWSISVRGKAK